MSIQTFTFPFPVPAPDVSADAGSQGRQLLSSVRLTQVSCIINMTDSPESKTQPQQHKPKHKTSKMMKIDKSMEVLPYIISFEGML